MDTSRPAVTVNDVAPSYSIDRIPAAEPLESPAEPPTAAGSFMSHQNTTSEALMAPKWSSQQPSSSSTTPATRTATADIDATSCSTVRRKASIESAGAPSLLRSSNTPNVDRASSTTPVKNTSSIIPSGEGDNASHGALPEWAYFYDPALSHAQVRYIESQMKSQEEYQKIPPDQRQSVVVNDLQQALSSMRLVYSRSTIVANSTPDKTKHGTKSPTAITSETMSQSAHQSAQSFNVEDVILAGRPGSDVVTENRANSEMQRGDEAPTEPSSKISPPPTPTASIQPTKRAASNFQTTETEKIPVAAADHGIPSKTATLAPLFELDFDASPRKSRGQPGHDLAKLSGNYIHGKRAANGDEVVPKRQRVESALVNDDNGRARAVSTSYVSRPAGPPLSPELHLQAAPAEEPVALTHSELPTEPHSSLPASLESSPLGISSDDDDYNQRLPSRSSRGREWPQEHVARLAEARAAGQPWDIIMQMLPGYSIHALRNKYKRIKQFGWDQHASHSRSATDDDISTQNDDTESGSALMTMSTRSGRKSELVDKQPDQSSNSYQDSSASRPRHDESHHGSTLQGNEAIGGANVGAMRKGGVVKWFDEEIRLLMDLYWQETSWEDIFEAIPRHTCPAIRTKVSSVKHDVRWAPKAQNGLSRKSLGVDLNRDFRGAKDHMNRNESVSRAPGVGSKVQHQLVQPRQNAARERKLSRKDKGFIADSSGRLYTRVIDKLGRKLDVDFLLLPGNYDLAVSEVPGLPWICPIRSCRLAFLKPSSLDFHWARTHRKCLLSDNDDGTFSIKGQYQPKKVRTANAVVISQNLLDPKEPPMAEARSYRQVQLDKVVKQSTADNQEMSKSKPPQRVNHIYNGVSYRNGVTSQVVIPDDLTMATNIRAYREWPDGTGALGQTYGALLPANYRLAEFHGFEWLCPIRTCGRIMPTLKGLGCHFSVAHHGVLLNDNRDGTFTDVGQQIYRDGKKDHRPIMVESKKPLPPNAPPRAEPNASPHNLQLQIELAASIAEWQNTKPAKRVKKEPTVDETLERKSSSAAQAPKRDAGSSELLGAVTLADAHTLEPEVMSAEDVVERQALEAVDLESDVETAGALELMTTTAHENWAIIQDLFTSKKLPPPQSGILKELMSLPRLRDIETNPVSGKKPCIQWPKDVSLLIVQLVGQESPTACNKCSRGHGIFSSCVVVSQDVANVLQGGICACVNCSWKSNNQRFCDLRKLLKGVEMASVGNRTSARNHRVDATEQNAHADSTDVGATESDQPLRIRRSDRPLTSDDSDSGHDFQVRHPRRLKSNATEDHVRIQTDVTHTVSMTEGKVVPVRKMTHTTEVDKSFSFRVDVIPPRTRLQLRSDLDKLRICSLVTGKVAVKVHGEQRFDIGFQGMFRLMPGVEAEVLNASGFDAVLQISSFRER